MSITAGRVLDIGAEMTSILFMPLHYLSGMKAQLPYIYQEKIQPQVETWSYHQPFHTQPLLWQFTIPSLLLIVHNSYKLEIPLFSDHTNDILFHI